MATALQFFIVGVAFLGFVLPPTEALKCYHCNNCDDDAWKIVNCTNGVCLTINQENRLQMSCGHEVTCVLGSVENEVTKAWNWSKHFLKGVVQGMIAIPDDTKAVTVDCCTDDLCNAAPSKTASSVAPSKSASNTAPCKNASPILYIFPLAIACFLRL